MPDRLERGYASVANEEYRKGYRDGWRDAMVDQKSRPVWPEPNFPPMKPTPYDLGLPWNTQVCSKCGAIVGPYQVCRTMGCPMMPTTYYKTKTTDNTSE